MCPSTAWGALRGLLAHQLNSVFPSQGFPCSGGCSGCPGVCETLAHEHTPPAPTRPHTHLSFSTVILMAVET